MLAREERLSRRFAHALRHAPEAYGLTLTEDGSVDLAEFAAAMETRPEVVLDIVAQDAKGRYIVGNGRIWAAQGHSRTVNVPMEQVQHPGVLFHGTLAKWVPSILDQGLLPMTRQHVHLTKDLDAAYVSGARRKDAPAVLSIDGNQLATRHTVLRSENDVYLTELVPAELILSVEFTSTP